MKLATMKSATRDGTLVVVSRDLTRACAVAHIAPTLQAALDNWAECESALDQVYQSLNAGTGENVFTFDPAQAESPLPAEPRGINGTPGRTRCQ